MADDEGPSVEHGSSTADLERLFHRAMVEIYTEAKRIGYIPTYFAQMLSEMGGLAAAKQLLAASQVSDGFTRLWELGRLDLSVEAHVLRPEFEPLFSEDQRDAARRRLRDYGFES